MAALYKATAEEKADCSAAIAKFDTLVDDQERKMF